MLKTLLSNWLIPAIVLIVALFAAFFFGTGWAGVIVLVILGLILVMAIVFILQGQKNLYREKRISRAKLVRNVLFEVTVILVAMLLAALLGRYIADIATAQVSHGLMKFMLGILIGLLAGMGVGFVVKQTWGRLAKA